MAVNYGNTQILHYTTLDTFPQSQALTGTVSVGVGQTSVQGNGTIFMTEIPDSGDCGYLWNGSDEWRKITNVVNDYILNILQPFSTDLIGATVKWIPPTRARSVAFTDIGNSGTVDNISLASNEGGSWTQTNFVDPPIDPHMFSNVDVTVSYT